MADNFEKELEIMKMYITNAGLYIRLSTAALALTVGFPNGMPRAATLSVGLGVKATWVGFLVAIGAGAFYHYLAGKYMENLLPDGAGFRFWNRLADQCGLVYGLMLLSFYVSASLFTVNALFAVLN